MKNLLSILFAAALLLSPAIAEDVASDTTESMIRACVDQIRRERQAFQEEMAEYRLVFTNNPPDSVVVRSAIHRIAGRGEVSVPFLLELLRDGESHQSANARDALIRLRATGAMGGRTEEVYQAVHGIVARKEPANGKVRQNAAWILFRLQDPRLVDDLLALLPAENDKVVLLGMIRIFGELQTTAATEPLVGLLADARFDVRTQVVRTLGRIGGPTTAKQLLPGLDDPSYEVRKVTYEALGRIGDRTSLDALHAKLQDLAGKLQSGETGAETPEWREAQWALAALANIRHPSSLIVLKPLLYGTEYDLSRKVQDSVRGILDGVTETGDDGGAFHAIVSLLDVGNVSVVSSALQAVTTLRNPEAIPNLIRLIDSRNATLAGYAADALGEIASPDDRDAVRALKQRFKEVDSRRRGRDPRLLERLAFALAKLGQPSYMNVVAQPFKAKLKKDPRDIDTMVKLAEIHRDARDYGGARVWYRRAYNVVSNDPDRSQILYQIGVCYALADDFDKADSEMAKARKLGFRFTEELFEKGELHRLRDSDSQPQRDYYRKLRRQSGLAGNQPSRPQGGSAERPK